MGQVRRGGGGVGIVGFLGVMLWGALVHAAEVPNFPGEISIGQMRCVLNGFGLRKKFVVDVYYGALYVAEKSSDAPTIIQADKAKGIVMHFVYKEVEASKLVETWKEGFEKTAPNPSAALKSRLETFMGYFTEPVKKGEEIRLLYEPGVGTHVMIKGHEKGVVPGADFMQALWGIFLGDKPASEALKKGMLGQS
ncbi:chalcone isomerase family protein [Desulfosoma sp.]|uniref:chalcone isomerase family protein n=1 Tax=Desulfosoma sp. TaxID=2603217 RepID=UPI004049DD6B